MFYKVYYDKQAQRFACDDKMSKLEDVPSDSTTNWFDTLSHAKEAVLERNANCLDEVRICKDCNEPFWMTKSEQEWFTVRGLKIPVRCAACRKKRKENAWNSLWQSIE